MESPNDIGIPMSALSDVVCSCKSVHFIPKYRVKYYAGAMTAVPVVVSFQEWFCSFCGKQFTPQKNGKEVRNG